MINIALVALFWGPCGMFTACAFLYDIRRVYGTIKPGHVAVAAFLALLGPIGVGVGIAALLRDRK